MPRVKCTACGGVFEELLPDGLRYFHVCAPLSLPELDAAVKTGRVLLPVGETVDVAIARREYQRTGARNENVVAPIARGAAATITAAGKGVTPAAPALDVRPVLVPD